MAKNILSRGVPKSAWGLAVAGGGIWLLFGLLILILPGDPGNRVFFTGDPSTYSAQATNDLVYSARVVGVSTLVGGLLQIAIGLTAFRRGERWAWYAFATVLIELLFSLYLSYTGERNSPINTFIQFLPIWLPQSLAMLLSIRSFFPARLGATPSN